MGTSGWAATVARRRSRRRVSNGPSPTGRRSSLSAAAEWSLQAPVSSNTAGYRRVAPCRSLEEERDSTLGGVRGRIVCAAVPRAQVVSGFDLVGWKPKPAQRAVPAGSVYWLELDEGVAAEDLRKLAERGLWTEEQYSRDMRPC
ncbi:MAG: type III-B CRISPR module-associated Cmr3 family protein [Burkholderiales bacterium]|nr:type III-B CRISPR module-associated Cmr3 family protein [Burkholderiales bacterium]